MNIFLDCGSNVGQGYEQLKQILNFPDDSVVHMFEANPFTYAILANKYAKNKQFILHNVAVWNKNEKRIMNLEKDVEYSTWTGGTSNILAQNFKLPSNINAQNMGENPPLYQCEVSCIDFSSFIAREFSKNDNIVCKLDIEGAEIETLDKMIDDGTLDLIKTIVVEFHFHMRHRSSHDINHYLNQFNQRNIQFVQWY